MSAPPGVNTGALARVRAYHTCERVCPACGWRNGRTNIRGLCWTCHVDLDIRERFPIKKRLTRWELVEDVEMMIGATVPDVCSRLDMNPKSLYSGLRRADRMDLWKRLKAAGQG